MNKNILFIFATVFVFVNSMDRPSGKKSVWEHIKSTATVPVVQLILEEVEHGSEQRALKILNTSPSAVQQIIKDDSFLFYSAIKHNYINLVKRLIQLGADVNQVIIKEKLHATPLIVAVVYKNAAMIEMLLANGADVNKSVIVNIINTPLISAVASEDPDLNIIKMLLKAGANPNVGVKEKKINPLIFAVYSNRLDIIELLLEYGAHVNAGYSEKNKYTTPLMLAIEKGFLESVRLLLKGGADIEAKNGRGASALIMAIIPRPFNLVYFNIVKALLAAGADANTKDKQGNTPLSLAVIRGHTLMVKALLDAGALLTEDIFNDAKRALTNRDEIIELLQEKQTNPAIKFRRLRNKL